MIRKITLGLTILLSGFAVNSYAKSPLDVSVPCYNGGFTFGLAGLYLRPSSTLDDNSIILAQSDSVDATRSTQVTFENIKPDFDWGYRVNMGYVFPGTGNDVTLTYSSFNHGESRSLTTETAYFEQANEKFNYQTVDLDLGQHIDIGCRSHFRFITGLRFASLETKLNTKYSENMMHIPEVPDPARSWDVNQYSRFRGIGPRFGSDFEYILGSGFGIVGQATGALLVGDFKNTFSELDVIPDGDNDNTVVFHPSRTRVVPNLNAKLGLNYNYQFYNSTHTKLTVEAGYQVDHFFNAADRVAPLDVINTTQTIDTSFAGPYVGIQIHL
jgi:Legionella pneumophila major outer membrane protein precursor